MMQQHASVTFYLGDCRTDRTGPVRVGLRRMICRVTPIPDPPRSLSSDVRLIGWIDENLGGVIDRMLF